MSESENQRLIELESTVMHLQNNLEQLNQVIIDQNQEIDKLRLEIIRLDGKIQTAEAGPENRSLEDERPPHY